MLKRAHLSSLLGRPRATRSEAGFTLPEMVFVIAIMIILALIAIPVFFLIQQSNAKSSVISDVRNTQANIASVLFTNPTANPIVAYYPQNKSTTVIPNGGVGVSIVRTNSGNIIKVTNAINDGSDPSAATGTGSYAGYEITGTNPKVPNWYYTYNSNTGKYTVNSTNNKSTNPLPTKVPTFNTNSLPVAVKNSAYSTTVSVSAQPAATFTATGLPTGLGIGLNSGTISGVPSVDGNFTVYVTASNSVGTTTKSYNLTVQTPPVVTSTSLPSGNAGAAYSQQVTATGTPSPTFNATGLPAGLAIDFNTGIISGTISSAASGSYTVNITVTNSAGNSTTSLVLVVNSAPTVTTTTLPNAAKGAAYTTTINTTGYPAPTFALSGTATGLSLDPNTGVLSGTPNVSGQYNLTITVTNPNGNSSKTLLLTITSPANITTTSLPAAIQNTAYTAQLNATGYPTPTFTVTGLPTGLSATSSGAITGTPTTAGSYTVTVTATNTINGTVNTDSKTFSLAVNSVPTITTTTLATATQGSAYSQQINATGTPAPTFAATGLPAGLTINTNTGLISGTPTGNGTANVTITVTNSAGSAQQTYTLTTNGTLAAPANVTVSKIFGNQATISWSSVPNATSYTVTYSGGGSGTHTTTTTTVTDTQGITTTPNAINVSVVANASGYLTSPTGTTTITMPGASAAQGFVFSACPSITAAPGVNANCAISSTDGTWTATMQSDGNFVLYKNNLSTGSVTAYGATQTNTSGSYMSVQTDGNLVLYSPSTAIKASNTYGQTNVRLNMQTDGNLVLYNGSGTAIWGMYNVGAGNTVLMQYVGGSNVSIVDASAETCDGATWHTYYGPATACATDQYYDGSHSWKITTSGNNPDGIIDGPNNINVAAGQRVLMNLYVKGTPGETWYVGGRQGNPYNEGMSGYTLVTDGTWQRISVIWTAPSGGYQTPYIQMRQANVSSGKYIYSDAISTYVGF